MFVVILSCCTIICQPKMWALIWCDLTSLTLLAHQNAEYILIFVFDWQNTVIL